MGEELSGNNKDKLSKLRESKFLSHRIFKRVSENMHYEIFKYVNPIDLLNIRGVKQGGYELTSNKLLRSRICNYLGRGMYGYHWMSLNIDSHRLARIIQVIFDHTGTSLLDCRGARFGVNGLLPLINAAALLGPNVNGLSFGIIYIYIYIYI